MARLELDKKTLRVRATELVKQLMAGNPIIHVNTSQVYESALLFNPICLRVEDVEAIARRLQQLIQ